MQAVIASLVEAIGVLPIRRVVAHHRYIPYLHLLPHLETLSLYIHEHDDSSNTWDMLPLCSIPLTSLCLESPFLKKGLLVEVSWLASLDSLRQLTLQNMLAKEGALPYSLTHLNLDQEDWTVADDYPVCSSLQKFAGHLRSLILCPNAARDFQAEQGLSSLHCLQQLAHLSLNVDSGEPTSLPRHVSFPNLLTLDLRLQEIEASSAPCDFSGCPKLKKAHLEVYSWNEQVSLCDLSLITGLRTSFLAISLLTDPTYHVRVDFAGWELEGASISYMSTHSAAYVPCRSAICAKVVLAMLSLELPQDKIQEDKPWDAEGHAWWKFANGSA